MTIVEFYDPDAVNNVVSALSVIPDKIIFVGEKNPMKKQAGCFERFFVKRNLAVKPEYCGVNRNSLSSLVEVLDTIAKENPDCHFDLTGGDDLVLVAAGIVYERCLSRGIRLQLHRYNVRNSKITDCDLDGNVLSETVPSLTVEENMILHGGVVVTEEQDEDGTILWDVDDRFAADVNKMWEICRKDCGSWNVQITNLGEIVKLSGTPKDELFIHVGMKQIRDHFSGKDRVPRMKSLYYKLQEEKLISGLKITEECFELSFRSRLIRECLTKAGTILELKTFLLARRTGKYNDAMTGVLIDWDGVVHDAQAAGEDFVADTKNEIDVVLMDGLVPVFISCKNGSVGEDELYKLNTVAQRFGGEYAKKVLIATTLGKKTGSRSYFRERARDMRIRLIEGVHDLTEEQFLKQIRNLTSA